MFRNAARLRLLLGLVTLNECKDNDVRLYTSLIRTALLANGGKPPRRLHELNDRKGERSIAAEAVVVGPPVRKESARQTSQRQEAKESARRRERKIQRLLREGRRLPAKVAPPEPTHATLDLD